MKIPSDEEIQWQWETYFSTDDEIRAILLWGLAQRARAMKAEHELLHDNDIVSIRLCRECHREFAQWLQAAADEVGVELEADDD